MSKDTSLPLSCRFFSALVLTKSLPVLGSSTVCAALRTACWSRDMGKSPLNLTWRAGLAGGAAGLGVGLKSNAVAAPLGSWGLGGAPYGPGDLKSRVSPSQVP